MATGPTGFKFNYNGSIVDFFDIFEPGNSGFTTGYTIGNEKDLGQLFMASGTSGNSGITTGYKYPSNPSTMADLGSIFQRKLAFLTDGAYYFGITASYQYAIFASPMYANIGSTNTAPGTSITGATLTPKYSTTLYFVCVGGGGGGGGAKGNQSNGGGGGGGLYLNYTDAQVGSGTYYINVGKGGAGGAPADDGFDGEPSQVSLNNSGFIIKCTGGIKGTTGGGGTGGLAYINNSSNWIEGITGGFGGDPSESGAGNGQPSSYNSGGTRYLDIPQEVLDASPAYISKWYSGGAGGGKRTNNDSSNFSGGQGGGTVYNATSSTNTGSAGQGGKIDQPASDGFPGNGYGSGGGGGGNTSGQTRKAGGPGAQGIVVAYALLPPLP